MSSLIVFAKFALATAVAVYLGMCALLYLIQARLLFPGVFMPVPPGIEIKGRELGLEPILLETRDGESLHLLHRAPAPGRPVVLVFHGNASYPEDYGFLYLDWLVEGYGIVAPVARGYRVPQAHHKARICSPTLWKYLTG